ncbi:G4 quadruplex nucleic acid binding protein [Trapelia coarctata]|nr:G4 quadruplex nucleic acid binding protein [Trapelia coarctata]
MSAQEPLSTSHKDIIHRLFPSAATSSTAEVDIPHLSHSIYPNTSYTDAEKLEIQQWLTNSDRLATKEEDEAKHAERLGSLNIHLSTRTTLLGSKPSIADTVLYAQLASAVKSWAPEERTGERGYHHIVRYIDFVQNAPIFQLSISEADKIAIDPSSILFIHKPLDPKEEKERKKKEKALASAPNGQPPLVVGQSKPAQESTTTANPVKATDIPPAAQILPQQTKKEKKEKAPKQPKAPAKPETPLSPCLIDLRVGHILRCIPHPNADSLYVSTIACGDAPGTPETSLYEATQQTVRTVCSGLNGLIPIEEMQNRKIIAVCNLKPVTMRGIKSAAMVLAASPRIKEGEIDDHKGPVELVEPPAEAKAGERVWFEGWEGEPESVLNPKKKVWEMLQPGFTTMEDGSVAFEWEAVEPLKERGEGKPGVGRLVVKGGGECRVKSLKGATVR